MIEEYILATPKMASNNTPSGICSASHSHNDNYLPWYAFNRTLGYDQQTWATTQSLPQWIQYKFEEPTCIKKVCITNRNEQNIRAVQTFIFQGSNNGIDYDDLATCTSTSSAAFYKSQFYINNNNEYLYYRLYITANFNNATGTGCGISEIELYKVNIKISLIGNIEAIGDWLKNRMYSKNAINDFFLKMNDNLTGYICNIIAKKDDVITITGRTSNKEYKFTALSNNFKVLLFFARNETIEATNGTDTVTITLSEPNVIIYLNNIVYENSSFEISPKGTSIDDYIGPYNFSNNSQIVTLFGSYFGSNKILLGGYNCNLNFRPIINQDQDLTQNIISSYGPNNTVFIPIIRKFGVSKIKYIAKRNSATRFYITAVKYTDANSELEGAGIAVNTLSDEYAEYEKDVSSLSYIDYIQFLTEQGCPVIKKIWLE